MRLDVNALRYLSKEEYRVLQAIELGQKNVSSSLQCLMVIANSNVIMDLN